MFSVSDHGAVRVLGFNRPSSYNALTTEMVYEFPKLLRQAGKNDSIKVVVLTGTGTAFCAGMDLDVFANPEAHDFEGISTGGGVQAMFDAVIDFPKPLICAVNGVGAGFGFTVCGLADITIMADEAKLVAPFVDLGVVPEGSCTYSFPQLMGPQLASWLLYSGESIDGQACKQAGFALDSVPREHLMDEVMKRAQIIANKPLLSLLATKALMRRPHLDALKQANKDEMLAFPELFYGPDCRNAIEALLKQRAFA